MHPIRPEQTIVKPTESEFAEAIRSACIAAANDAWEDAGIQGLCAEGRWEVVLGALRGLDLTAVISTLEKP